jgi:hypothetical protein
MLRIRFLVLLIVYFSPLTARTNSVGYVVQTGVTTGKLLRLLMKTLYYHSQILKGIFCNNISTGVYEFSGITKASNTTFNIAFG